MFIMMRMMNNKKNVKIFSIVIAAIFIIGIGALAYTQMATPGTSAASNVGVIDMSRLDNPENPVYVKAAKEFTDYRSQDSSRYASKGRCCIKMMLLKLKLSKKTQANVEKKMEEMNKQMADQTMEAAKAVGNAKGLSVVLPKDAVLYGGVDITDQVLKKLASDANNNDTKVIR